MINTVLVPLDGSRFSEHALPLALAIARRAGATLHLAHVHQPMPPATVAGVALVGDVEDVLKKDELAYLDKVVHRLTERHKVVVQAALLDGEVSPALEGHAERVSADLVVLATHGRGALGRFWLGSVADELVRHLTVPAILVRPHEEPVDLEKEPPLAHVVVPLDGTPLAEQALEPALALGKVTGAHFTLVRVVQPVLRPAYAPEGVLAGYGLEGLVEGVQAHQKHLVNAAQNYLDEVAARLRAGGARVETRVLVDEQSAVGVLRVAQAQHADLIALSTHGRRWLSRLLLGSVADKVVRGSTTPVLVHRPKKA